MTSSSPRGTTGSLEAGSGWTVTHALDLDGNGKADLLLRHTDGTIYGWLMDGLNVVLGTTLVGPGNWSIVPAQN